jgi:hypothetical protein
MKNLFSNEEGMSLVSVTIAAGLMGLLAVMMMRMQDNQLKTQNDILIRADMNDFMQKLNFYFSNPSYCEEIFKNKTILPGGTEEIMKISTPNGKALYEVGQKVGNGTFKLISMKQEDFYFDSKDSTSGILTLNVSMEKMKKSFGNKIINKKLEIYLYSDINGDVSGCGNNPINLNQNTGKAKDLTAEEIKKFLTDQDISDENLKKVKDLQKVIENNPQLKMMQESIESIQEQNNRFDKKNENLNPKGKL